MNDFKYLSGNYNINKINEKKNLFECKVSYNFHYFKEISKIYMLSTMLITLYTFNLIKSVVFCTKYYIKVEIFERFHNKNREYNKTDYNRSYC